MIEHFARFLVAVYTDRNNPTAERMRALELLLEIAKRDPQTVSVAWAQADT